jgi:hypothetical protein
MQKKLADYFRLLLERRDQLLVEFYEPGSLMLADEAIVIMGLLVGLNVVDCNLCVKVRLFVWRRRPRAYVQQEWGSLRVEAVVWLSVLADKRNLQREDLLYFSVEVGACEDGVSVSLTWLRAARAYDIMVSCSTAAAVNVTRDFS